MASIRRSDIMHKKYSKGRPAKPERERVNRRQEAYKWRDARRVYLASSFDRWRKLRSSLKLKDSSLAWHLMEAHEKGQCTNCGVSDDRPGGELTAQRRKCDQAEFLPSLISSIRQLCHAYFDFEECIEIVGLLCLEFDKKRKENFSVNELIKSGSKPALPSYVSKSLHQQVQHDNTEQDCGLALSVSNADQHSTHPANNLTDSSVSTTLDFKECHSLAPDHSVAFVTECQSSNVGNPGQDTPEVSSSSKSPDVQVANVTADTDSFSSLLSKNDSILDQSVNKTEIDMNIPFASKDTRSSSIEIQSSQMHFNLHKVADKPQELDLCTESEVFQGDDSGKADPNMGEDKCSHHDESLEQNYAKKEQESDPCHKSARGIQSRANNPDPDITTSDREGSQCNKEHLLLPAQSRFEGEAVPSQCPAASQPVDLPLDMSVLKSSCKKEIDHNKTINSSLDSSMDNWSISQRENEGSRHDTVAVSPYSGKRKVTESSNPSTQMCRRSPFRLECKFGGKQRDESHASIPWQRRDMSRKEEYEFLELNPFCDLAEFSQRYPHVHQRTYYRWKRRIKEEYIILEQCPEMSFQEFSSVVLQAKESVFHHWKALIAQGKGFFAPSDTSKRLEAKCSPKPTTLASNEYNAIQKNLSLTYEQFCQQHPGTTVDTFNHLKRRALQEFWLFHQNQHMSYKDFSKVVNVSEEVFNVWKEYIESLKLNSLTGNLNVIPNSVSPNPPISLSSFQSLGSPSSSGTDRHSQSPKDNLFNVVSNNHAALKDSLAAVHAGALNSALTDSVARSLSSSYLASLQNMMFPWHSYYGMTAPIGQQMLPMMLWPGMMGLASGIANPLSLASSSHAAGASSASSVTGLHSSLLDAGPENSESPKVFESQGKHQTESQNKNKRPANDISQDISKTLMPKDGEKKLKLSNEKEEGDFWGPFSRSRKQNKQEYVYYLKNPELCFRELESLFPTISMRTFYRWRKEMNAAVLLLEDNKDMTFQQFQMVFPDIPEDIFESWKEKAGKDSSILGKENQPILTVEAACVKSESAVDDPEYQEQPLALDRVKSESEANMCQSEDGDEPVSSEDTAHQKKCSKEEYLYVQKNPNADFTTFSRLYPNTSVRSFYRWKKELKDAVDYLRANPDVDFETYKTMDGTASEEVFSMWKTLAQQVYPFDDDDSENATMNEDRDSRMPAHVNRKLSGPEYWFLQQHPYIELSQFTRTYPQVPKRTFYRWKQEIHQIMNYIRSQPNVEFSEIAAVLPEVSMEAFLKWKEIIASETKQSKEMKDGEEGHATEESSISSCKPEVDEHTKNLMTNALLYLMHHPTIKYKEFKSQFEFVSAATFELWLNRIKTVILHIAADPDMDYAIFSMNVKDVDEDIFDIWKGLDPDDISAVDISDGEAQDTVDGESQRSSHHPSTLYADNELLRKAVQFCQRNPDTAISVLQDKYPTISAAECLRWQSEIKERWQYLRQNRNIEFKEFSKQYPFIQQEVFEEWKADLERDDKLQKGPSPKVLQDSQTSAQSEIRPNLFDEPLEAADKQIGKCTEEDGRNPEKSCTADYVKQNNHNHISHSISEPFQELEDIEGNLTECTLSKLARFADSNAVAYSSKYMDEIVQKLHHTDSYIETQKSLEAASSTIEQLYKNNNNKNNSGPTNVESFFHNTSTPVSATLGYSAFGPEADIQLPTLGTSSLHNSSLSALMAMSKDSEAVGKGNSSGGVRSEQCGSGMSTLSGTSLRQGVSNGPLSFINKTALKEDDEGFSSQRQKKMSRAEYMFVKDNPDVDSQEFSRIFPGVSARTFYRWKKEIKAQLQLA